MKHLELGILGEKLATDYLLLQGYKILANRFRVKIGELDIVGQKGETIIFFEVKTRTNTLFGQPSEAVNYRKQNKIINTAMVFLKQNNLLSRPIRFDIIEVYITKQDNCVKTNHIENAFGR